MKTHAAPNDDARELPAAGAEAGPAPEDETAAPDEPEDEGEGGWVPA